jgi:hypothetical protein
MTVPHHSQKRKHRGELPHHRGHHRHEHADEDGEAVVELPVAPLQPRHGKVSALQPPASVLSTAISTGVVNNIIAYTPSTSNWQLISFYCSMYP